jgi:hypothetical protein
MSAAVEELKESIKKLSETPDCFSGQASSCEAVYKSRSELKNLVQDKRGRNEFLQNAEEQCTQTIFDFSRDLSSVMNACMDV